MGAPTAPSQEPRTMKRGSLGGREGMGASLSLGDHASVAAAPGPPDLRGSSSDTAWQELGGGWARGGARGTI